MRKLVSTFLVFISITSLLGCSKQIPESSYNDLITSLETMNFSVIAEDVEKNILKGQRKWLTIDEKENISVYLYESNEKMEEDSLCVDEGGSSYSAGKNEINISWISYPHFFKKDNIIVLYVGEDSKIINGLKEIMGIQFAGYTK